MRGVLAIAVALLWTACGGGAQVPDAAPPALCGDGVAAGDEACDGADLRGKTCADFDFSGGRLACLAACVVDLRGCAGGERCANGVDDDGDGDKDCDDLDCRDSVACARCGDSRISGAETCDDGNDSAGDCCFRCAAEPGCELERNDDLASAVHVSPGAVRGAITPAGDIDVYELTVPAGSTGSITAETRAAGPSDCFRDADSRLEILDGAGQVVASDDDAGEGTCSRVGYAGLAPGPARVRVAASTHAQGASFQYELSVTLVFSPCGDGTRQEGQECDDGNLVNGDGCSSACRLEPVAAREPDDDAAAALGPLAPPFVVAGTTDAPGADNYDADWTALDLAAPANLRIELFAEEGDCGGLVARLALRRADGSLVARAGAEPDTSVSCSRIDLATPLPAGRYFVEVGSRPAPQRYRLYVTIPN